MDLFGIKKRREKRRNEVKTVELSKEEFVDDNSEQERLMADYEKYKTNILKYGETVMTFEEYCQSLKDIDLFVSEVTTFADSAKSEVETYEPLSDKVRLQTEQLSEINNSYRYTYSPDTVDSVIRHGDEYENLVEGKRSRR